MKEGQVPKWHHRTSQVVLRRWGKWRLVVDRKEGCEGWRADTRLPWFPCTSGVVNTMVAACSVPAAGPESELVKTRAGTGFGVCRTHRRLKTLVHLSKCWYKICGGRGLSLEHTVSLWWENILFLVDKYRSNLSAEMSVHYSPVNAL